jgi:hypothetical protein
MSNENPVFIVDLNELDGDDVPIAMDFTVDHGPGIRSTNIVRPSIGQWIRIHSDADDTLYYARVVEDLSDRDLLVRIDWESCTPVLNAPEWSARAFSTTWAARSASE